MTVLISGDATIAPTLANMNYAADREARSVVHPIIGRPFPDVTLRPAGSRTGTLHLMFATEAAAAAAAEALALPRVWAQLSPEQPSTAMRFVVQGTISAAQVPGFKSWTVDAGFVEVAP
jgi:hypothetical protein